jgi:hypothetical protein
MQHIGGGDRCREFFGVDQGSCGQPATDGLCPEHAQQRLSWEADMREATDPALTVLRMKEAEPSVGWELGT